MPKKAIPVHQKSGYGENGESEPAERPYEFKKEAPQRAEVKRMHGPDNPVASGSILSVVPDGENASVCRRNRNDVTMRKIARCAEIDQCVDDSAGEQRIAKTKQLTSWRCLMDGTQYLLDRSAVAA